MRAIIALILIPLFFLSACSSSPTKYRKRVSKRPPKQQSRVEQPATVIKKQKRQTKKYILPSVDSGQKILLPTRISPVDGTLMVLINPPIQKNHQLHTPMGTLTHSTGSSGVKAFYIDHTEVTVEQYKKTHPKYDETYITGEKGCPSCPAMGVDWKEARLHCRSVGKRLPTEEEWETAAQGPSKRSLPWGNKMEKQRANLVGEEDGFLSVAPVGSFPLGAGPYGAMDMIGNVWEWVDAPDLLLPMNPGPKKDQAKTLRIAKGGSWASPHQLATISYRNVVDGAMKNPTFGFRCVKTVE